MLKVGLTGGIGSGKTSVSDLFKKSGATVIDTDIIARQLVENDSSVLKKIAVTFGQDILNLDGTLNRKKLANIVFHIKEHKAQLEDILHPIIRDEVISQLQKLEKKPVPPDYVIVVVPLLFEANYEEYVDRILVVSADKKERIKRIQLRDNRSMSEINSIIGSQTSVEKQLLKANDIIKNNSEIKDLDTQIATLHQKYTQLSGTIK